MTGLAGANGQHQDSNMAGLVGADGQTQLPGRLYRWQLHDSCQNKFKVLASHVLQWAHIAKPVC